MNQGVFVDMLIVLPLCPEPYIDEYSSVPISGLLDIDTNLMMPTLGLRARCGGFDLGDVAALCAAYLTISEGK
jgi:hypothetical protein